MEFYEFKPSLQHLALTKMTIGFWRQKKIVSAACKLYNNVRPCHPKYTEPDWADEIDQERDILEKWLRIESKVLQNVTGFAGEVQGNSLPRFIKPIGLEILKWMIFISKFCEKSVFKQYLRKLQWNAVGFVDTEGMAKMMVQDEAIDRVDRLRLACTFGLKGDIARLYLDSNERELDEVRSSDFKGFGLFSVWLKGAEHGEIEVSFDERLDGIRQIFTLLDCTSACRIFFCCFEEKDTVESSLRYAIAVLFDAYCNWSTKVHPVIPRYRCPLAYNAEFFLFILSKAREHNVKLFDSNAFSALLVLFLEWPLQNDFQSVILRGGFSDSQLRSKVVKTLLATARAKHYEGYTECDYSGLFRAFWESCTAPKKVLFMENVIQSPNEVFFEVLIHEDVPLLEMILDGAPIEYINILPRAHIQSCLQLYRDNKIETLTYFLHRCLQTTSEIRELEMGLHLVVAKRYRKNRNMYLGIFPILDELDAVLRRREREQRGIRRRRVTI